ncbi:peroxiredoxin [Leptolyngbya sp. FACHB-261]|nr:peroxiredoxin [Leptolyngbya sp. FACHB-261]
MLDFLRRSLERLPLLQVFLSSCLACLLCFQASPALAQWGTTDLPPLDSAAPEFTLPSNAGDGEIGLSDYRGQWLVVYFYPKNFTSGCTLEARRFQKDLPQYRKLNTQILGISADSVSSHTKFCDSEGLTFPLLSDPNGRVSAAYGSWMGDISLRNSFIIDPEGVIREEFVLVNPSSHSSEVLARLKQLQTT